MEAAESIPPVVCTLTSKQLAAQRLEWADLAQVAQTRRMIDGGVATTYSLTLADQIEELANREISCCGSWLDITHERANHEFRLQLTTTNPDGVDVIRSMSGF